MKKIKLGELCKPSAGQIKEDSDKLIDYIDISSVDNETKKVTGYQTIAFRDAPSRARKMVKRGSILVSTVRPNLNAVAMLEDDTPNITIASTGFCILDCKENANNRFIFNFCKSRAFIDDMVSQATGASYPAVSDKIVRSALVPDYSYEEQCKISEVLDRLSAVIDNRKAELSVLDELIRARFVEMFGDPVLNEKGWKIVTVGDIVTEVRYGTSKPAVEGGKYPYLRMNNLTADGHLDLKDLKYIDISEDEIEKCVVRKGDVLFNRTNSIELVGKTAVFDLTEEMVIAGYIIRVRLNKEMLPVVFSQYMNLEPLKVILRGMAKGAVNQANINAQELQSIKVYIPDMKLQNQFADFVQQIDKSKDSVQKALDEAQLLFDSLMQQYFG